MLEPLLKEIQTKIQQYDRETSQYKESQIGATKPLDEDNLNKLEKAAKLCPTPVIDVSNVRNMFNQTKAMIDELESDMNANSEPLISGINRKILDIKDDDNEADSTQKFTELKKKCEELAKGYKTITKATNEMIGDINLRIAEYSQLFEVTKTTVLAGIQKRVSAIVGTLSEPPTDPDGAQLIQDIDGLLNSVN